VVRGFDGSCLRIGRWTRVAVGGINQFVVGYSSTSLNHGSIAVALSWPPTMMLSNRVVSTLLPLIPNRQPLSAKSLRPLPVTIAALTDLAPSRYHYCCHAAVTFSLCRCHQPLLQRSHVGSSLVHGGIEPISLYGDLLPPDLQQLLLLHAGHHSPVAATAVALAPTAASQQHRLSLLPSCSSTSTPAVVSQPCPSIPSAADSSFLEAPSPRSLP
ncbi:hypothetical protein B296_00024047, partial [Ensete ventricosum]